MFFLSFLLGLCSLLQLSSVHGFARFVAHRKRFLHQQPPRLPSAKPIASVSAANDISSPTFAFPTRQDRLRSGIQKVWSKRVFCNFIYFFTGFENVRAMHVYGKLVSMCTGNTVRTVTAVAEGRYRDAVSPGGVVVGYVLGTALSRFINFRLRRSDEAIAKGAPDVNGTRENQNEESPILDVSTKSSRSFLGRFARGIVPAILVLYGLADIFSETTVSAWMQACAYGLLYTTAQELVGGGMIFFAITGHYTVFAKSAVDAVVEQDNVPSRKRVFERAEYLFSFMVGVWFAVKAWGSLVASVPTPLSNILQGHLWKGVVYAIAFWGVQYSV